MLEAAALAIGTAVAKTACGVWLGKDTFADAAGKSVIDLAAGRLAGLRNQRQFRRLWEQAAEEVASRVEPVVAYEFRNLPDHERLAAMDAVADTLDVAVLTEADVFAQDLDAGFLNRVLRARDAGRGEKAALSADATELYNLLLRECCGYLIEIVRTLPTATVSATAELLARERLILQDIRTVLQRIPVRRDTMEFEHDYRQLVANRLDEVELFGITLSEQNRRYPLSVAYLNLRVSRDFVLPAPITGLATTRADHPDTKSAVSSARVDRVLAATRRLFVRGQAGIGKTTLLHWIAVHCARGSFSGALSSWQGSVPFLISLRRYADEELPAPENFLSEIGRHIADEKPGGWVHDQLRGGRGVLLVDGVDELPERRRAEARRWLCDLVSTFPQARFVVTSRPAAAPADWLGHDFDVAEIEPMTPADTRTFVRRWHAAMQANCADTAAAGTLAGYQEHLLGLLDTRGHLRKLAGYPLLCALLCALHKDRRGHLPETRMELYEVALHMLLERRDNERGTGTGLLGRTDSTLLLRDVAYWLVRNDLSSADASRVRERLAAKLPMMPRVNLSANAVYRLLLERSGLLREASAGRTDFVHRSFQEYLAAAEAVAVDDVRVLVANAHRDTWFDVIILAAGHASPKQRAELLSGLISRASTEAGAVHEGLKLVAFACLETSSELSRELLDEIKAAASGLLPPRNSSTARAVARAGSFALDLLATCEPKTVSETTSTIRAIAAIADPAGLPLLRKLASDKRKTVVKELVHAWRRFDADDYARTVLSEVQLPGDHLDLDDPELVPALGHLRQVKSLYCGFPKSDFGLGFVTSMPQLEKLGAQDAGITTLAPLANSNIKSFNLYSSGRDAKPLSLGPLAELGTLQTFRLWSRSVTDVAALAQLPNLRGVRLDYLMDRADIGALSCLEDLEEFGIGHIEDLTDLSELDFLRAPKSIGINSCPINDDLGHVVRWSDTLERLSLRGMNGLDLSKVAGLTALEFLDIQNSTVIGIGSLNTLPNLTEIATAYDPATIAEFRRLPMLRSLTITGDIKETGLDLAPLAGVAGLTIFTWPGITVQGAGDLGPGSRVRRL